MREHAVVLGGSGFIGSVLASELRRRGAEVDVVGSAAVDLTGPGAAAAVAELIDPGSTVVMAARSRNAPDTPERFVSDVAMTAAAAAAVERVQPARFVYFSSFAVYGEDFDNLAISEETRCAPTTYYGSARLAGESLARLAAGRASVPLLIVRPSSVFGPGDETGAYGPGRFVRQVLEQGTLRLFGDGEELRDYVFVDDVARAVADLVERGATGAINICSGGSASFAEIAELLGRIAPEPFEIESVPRSGPTRGSQQATPARLVGELPGFRFTPLQEGLAATYAAARAASR